MTETSYIDSSLPRSKPKAPKNAISSLSRYPQLRLVFSRKTIMRFGIGLLFLDVLFLNWKMLSLKPQNSVTSQESSMPRSKITDSNNCPTGCLVAINQLKPTSSVLPQPTTVPTASPAPTPFFTPALIAPPTQTTTVKEFFIPLGGGTTTSSTWITLFGLEAQVDSNSYASIKSVAFEASLRLPTGNGRLYARLINLSDNTPLEETEVYIEGSTGQRRERQFSLRSGNKVYGVQIRSTLGFEGILDMARIKIMVN